MPNKSTDNQKKNDWILATKTFELLKKDEFICVIFLMAMGPEFTTEKLKVVSKVLHGLNPNAEQVNGFKAGLDYWMSINQANQLL